MMKKELNILKSKTHGKANNNKNWRYILCPVRSDMLSERELMRYY